MRERFLQPRDIITGCPIVSPNIQPAQEGIVLTSGGGFAKPSDVCPVGDQEYCITTCLPRALVVVGDIETARRLSAGMVVC